MLSRVFRTFAAAAIPVLSLAAQQPAVRDLPRPAAEAADPFSMVSGAIEVKPGKVLVMDGTEGELALVDFTAGGSRTRIGRQGSGPGEYRIPVGAFRVKGDSIWLMDAAQMRIVTYDADFKPGPTIPFLTFDQSTGTALTAPYHADRNGSVYASTMAIQAGRGAGGMSMKFPDTVGVVRLDPRKRDTQEEVAKVRFPTSGSPEMKQEGTNFKYTMAYPGLVAADAWTVFPDGRIAIVRGANYAVEFITPAGRRSTPALVPHERVRVTDADRQAEMAEARRQMEEQSKTVQKMMPAGVNMTFDLLPPASWPDFYPPVAAMSVLAAPNGDLWIKRAVPIRVGRDQWDVVNSAGRVVARWRLPAKVTIVAVGQDAVYTARTDEDDLRYVQRVVVR
jgi:hypothetical protein